MSSRRPRWAPILIVVGLAMAAIVAVHSVREPISAAGWALVVNEPLAPADVIVVSLHSGGAGRSKRQTSCKAALRAGCGFCRLSQRAIHEFIRRGLPYEDASAKDSWTEVAWLMDVMQIPVTYSGTEGGGRGASVMVRPESVLIRRVCGR